MVIRTVEDFLEIIQRSKQKEAVKGNEADFLFRGQARDLSLLPRIARLRPKGDLLKIEGLVLAEFKRQFLPFLEFKPEDSYETMALAQHYGLPTRLLDWTHNALAGLWFAVREGCYVDQSSTPKAGVVWVLMPTLEDWRRPRQAALNELERPFFLRTRVIARRMSAQSGIFTFHTNELLDKGVGIETDEKFRNQSIKLIIPPESFAPIRDQLNYLGINDLSMFPDLGGLCDYLRYRYFHFDDEDLGESLGK